MKAKLQAGPRGGFTLLPPAADKCQVCATKHEPFLPHNQQSLYYQYWFYGKEGRWPTWADAMAHCTPLVREQWIAAAKSQGFDLLATQPGQQATTKKNTHERQQ